ncbi:acyl-homoserine-lactone synthase [Nonomuraea jabiensis]|uniref:acyl-homoserine-lactone synthase n=1 Tax=Nonomuraea jabiensis TaxID=882448 RepID=UPI0036AE78CB
MRERIVAGGASELPAWLVDGMFRLRHTVFHERLRRDVDSLHGRERDSYDDCDPVYVIAYAEGGQEVTGQGLVIKRTRSRYEQGERAWLRS